MDTPKCKNTIKNWKKSMDNAGVYIPFVARKGRYGGTYLFRDDLIRLAVYVSTDFGREVVSAMSYEY